MIIGKTKIDQSNYDCLVFCARDIKNIKIPNFIEHICSYSLNDCYQIEQFEIATDSKLRTIDERAFSDSSIEKIEIPPSVTYIGKNAFYKCSLLQRIEIPSNSKLKAIDGFAFMLSAINSIKIPSSVEFIGEDAFNYYDQLQIIEIASKEMILNHKTSFQNCRNALYMIPIRS